MIAGAPLRAARALLGLDQRALAKLCGLSLPTIQRMETSPGSSAPWSTVSTASSRRLRPQASK
jgi:hypothetical protein